MGRNNRKEGKNMWVLVVIGVVIGVLFSILATSSLWTSPVNSAGSENYETQEQQAEKIRSLDEEIVRFRNQIKGRNTSEWTLGEHATYASIRRREAEIF